MHTIKTSKKTKLNYHHKKKKKMKAHALMISVPFQGHINPTMNLALKLASKGITITFVHLEFVHRKLSEAHHSSTDEFDIFSDARESGLDIRYTTISDGLPLEFDRDLHTVEYWISLFHNFPARVDEFVGKMMAQSDPVMVPNLMVTDTIYAWSATIANKYNLVNVSFWTQPALVFSLLYHLDLLREKGHFLCKDEEELEINYVPGVKSISTKDLMSSPTDSDDRSTDSLIAAFEKVKKADFILHNTVHELEPDVLAALNKYQPNYAVGCINVSTTNSTISKSMQVESDCTHWLDSKPPGSVLYVSFGSVVQTSKHVIEELAHGLLLSKVNFIWVVREGVTGSADTNILPSGFEDEVRGRGLVIPWCNQIMVLSNPATGGFLTHCGWNSVVESMWCGVPMMCYPITYDQPTNRKLVVDDWRIGVSLCDGKFIDRKEVDEKIKRFMSTAAASKRLRQEAENVKQTLHKAFEIDGSSDKNFDQFLTDLAKKLSFN